MGFLLLGFKVSFQLIPWAGDGLDTEQVLKTGRMSAPPCSGLISPPLSYRTATLEMSLSHRSMWRCRKTPHTRGSGRTSTVE